jgi:hypothetical protein
MRLRNRVVVLFLLLNLFVLCLTSIGKASAFRGRGHQKEEEKKQRTHDKQTKSRASSSGKSSSLPSNFYERLGVGKKSTDKEIKKAYRKLAVKV